MRSAPGALRPSPLPSVFMETISLKTVLFGDEFTMVREGLAAICEASSYRVVAHCMDGSETLEALRALRPDLAVLDANLPRAGALDVVRQIRREGLNTKVVLLCTRTDRHSMLEALRGGIDALLLKSGPSQDMLEAFSEVLRGRVYVSPTISFSRPERTEPRRQREDPLSLLSAREYQVFTLLVDGVRPKEIAARLQLSPKTVDTHRASLMRKLEIYDVAGLVKYAIVRNLTQVA